MGYWLPQPFNNSQRFHYSIWHVAGIWTDENNRPLACELEYGGDETSGFAFWASQGSPLLGFIHDVIGNIVEGGIVLHIRNLDLYKMELESKFVSPTCDDTCSAINVRQLQTAFSVLMLGYVLAVVCCVSEIMWHRYRSKGRGPTGTSFCQGRHKHSC